MKSNKSFIKVIRHKVDIQKSIILAENWKIKFKNNLICNSIQKIIEYLRIKVSVCVRPLHWNLQNIAERN